MQQYAVVNFAVRRMSHKKAKNRPQTAKEQLRITSCEHEPSTEPNKTSTQRYSA